MLDEIIRKYERFSDAWILKVGYYASGNLYNASVVVRCMNALNNYEYETIEIFFIDVVGFRYINESKIQGVFVNAALVKDDQGIIMFDFFANFYVDDLRESEDSAFKVRCKSVSYTKIV